MKINEKPQERRRNRSFGIRYLDVKRALIAAGFAAEIDYQDEVDVASLTESQFLREAAWVILSAGMRESVIRCKFQALSEAFCSWKSARQIILNRRNCMPKALRHFGHTRKINAIVELAGQINQVGFGSIKERIVNEGVGYLMTLPYIGPVTCFHLAKNIGLDVVKPDRHLVRIASGAGFPCPESFCKAIAAEVGDKLCVIDLVLWRYATIDPDYVNRFC